MSNSETTFVKLIEHIRRDAGISNAMDAMEQLSLILLLKYVHSVMLIDTPKKSLTGNFKDLFFSACHFDNGTFKANIYELITVMDDIFYHQSDNTGFGDNQFKIETWEKIKFILDRIPLRMRSVKTLENLLYEIDDIYEIRSLSEDYDKLVVRMINDSLSAGAFYSPKALVSSIVKVVNPSPKQSIYDPAMGTGRFLIEAKNTISDRSNSHLNDCWAPFGKDISSFAHLVGSINLLLNGINIKNISLGDSLLTSNNVRYDIILSGIPFGKNLNNDSHNYEFLCATSSLEGMFLEHTMNVLALNGKAALIVPEGLLFNRTNELIELRRKLLNNFDLHSILSLPTGALAPSTNLKVSVLFFDNKISEKDIWFYELVTNKPLNKSNPIRDQDLIEFTKLFPHRSKSVNSCLVSKQDILNRKDFNLSLELPRPADNKSPPNIVEGIETLQKKHQEVSLLISKLTNAFRESKQAKFGYKFTIGDLFTARAGRALNTSEIQEVGPYAVYGGNGPIGYFSKYNRMSETIVIGRVGAHCGNVHLIKDAAWVTSNALSLELKTSQNVHLPYLAHVLRSLNLNQLARGAAQLSISFSIIKNVEIYLPAYEMQIELSEWFEEIQQNYVHLQNELDAQKEKANQLTEYVIYSNCIKTL